MSENTQNLKTVSISVQRCVELSGEGRLAVGRSRFSVRSWGCLVH